MLLILGAFIKYPAFCRPEAASRCPRKNVSSSWLDRPLEGGGEEGGGSLYPSVAVLQLKSTSSFSKATIEDCTKDVGRG